MKMSSRWAAGVGLMCALVSPARVSAAELTAFQLIKEGNRYVGEQAKDKVVQMRAEKSIGGLTPTIWHIVYYDPTATLKATEVKLGAGKMLDVKRPLRLLEPISGADEPLDRRKLKVDSDKAIKKAVQNPLLDKLKVTATAPKLERGSDGRPVWKVRVWAAKPRAPGADVDLGEVILSATDGVVVKNDLHIERVD